MEKVLKIVLLVVLLLSSVVIESAFAEMQKIAVLPLKGQFTQGIDNPSDAIIQQVTDAFFKTKRFNVIERSQLDKVLNEFKFQSAMVDEQSATSMGQLLGANLVLIGSYNVTVEKNYTPPSSYTDKKGRVHQIDASTSYPSKVSVNLRLIDVATGSIRETINASASSSSGSPADAFSRAMKDMSKKLDREVFNKFPVTGYLIKILSKDEAIIDLGTQDGVKEKDEFLVLEIGEDIIHPITKKVKKGQRKVVGELKVTAVSEDSATVNITDNDVPLKVGMVIETKNKKAGFFESILSRD